MVTALSIEAHIDLLNLITFFTATGGVIIAAIVLGMALEERAQLLRSGRNGALKLLSQQHVLMPAVFLCLLVLNACAAAVILFVPHTQAWLGVAWHRLVTYGLLFAAALCTASVWFLFQNRRAVLARIEQLEREGNARRSEAGTHGR